MAFSQKLVRLTIQLAANSQTNQPKKFAGSDSSKATLENHRTSVRVFNQGAIAGSTAQVRVWGLAPNLMVELATLGLAFNVIPRNLITIEAGDAGGMATVFTGTIVQCYADFRAQPDVPTVFECVAAGFEATQGAPMTSYTGATDVREVIKAIAGQLSYGFEDNLDGPVMLSAPAYQGSLVEQARQAAADAHVQVGLVNGSSGLVLAVWPWEGQRKNRQTPTIGFPGEMISYPTFTPAGIQVETLFDPAIEFGGKIKVNSTLLTQILGAQKANIPEFNVPPDSEWSINKIDLALDALLPNGQWSSTVSAWNPNQSRPVIG